MVTTTPSPHWTLTEISEYCEERHFPCCFLVYTLSDLIYNPAALFLMRPPGFILEGMLLKSVEITLLDLKFESVAGHLQ